jgi:hypothetical protein
VAPNTRGGFKSHALLAKTFRRRHDMFRQHAVAHNLRSMVEVVDQHVERGDPFVIRTRASSIHRGHDAWE